MINASDSIEETGKSGEITITTQLENDMIILKISDTDKGIPEHIKSKIFEPFFTTKDIGKGTGLGLSICYDIIQKHNGY